MRLPILETRAINKSFGLTQVLTDVSLSLFPGETLAVIGENGAGKSTLMKILAGVERPDSGHILLSGGSCAGYDVRGALALGINLIHQELNLAGNLSVAENIFLGREPKRFGLVRRRELHRRAADILGRVGLSIDPSACLEDLSLAQQQQVEIARALSMQARVIIFDEPTSSLTTAEAERLFDLIAEVNGNGIGVIYISHRLAEVSRIAQRVLVLRDGKNAGTLNRNEINHDAMVSLMVGRSISSAFPYERREIGAPALQVRDLRAPIFSRPINLEVKRGEIVGIGGLVGSGRTELLTALFGTMKRSSGEVRLHGDLVPAGAPAKAVRAGIALVPESRKEAGLALSGSIEDNLALPNLKRFGRFFVRRRRLRRAAQELRESLGIRCGSLSQAAWQLSGGNQQKIVFGKWLATAPSLFLLDEPTRGVDIGAKVEIYNLLFRLAGAGAAILFVSSELEELLGIADRVYVMHQGAVAGELERAQFSEQAVMRLATGGGIGGSV